MLELGTSTDLPLVIRQSNLYKSCGLGEELKEHLDVGQCCKRSSCWDSTYMGSVYFLETNWKGKGRLIHGGPLRLSLQ